MVQSLPRPEDMIRANQALPDEARQNMVLLRFAEPVSRGWLQHFYRVKLSPMMAAGGEGDFYRPEVLQPHRTLAGPCPVCHCRRARFGQYLQVCENRACRVYGRPDETQPMRGVIQVLVPSDLLQNPEALPGDQMASGCVLVLDRRYRAEVLAAVYRTCGMLCDQLGWKLK